MTEKIYEGAGVAVEKKYNSSVDVMAEALAQRIGSQVRVNRLIDPDLDRHGREKVGRYRIVIERVVDGQPRGFSSGDLKVNEAKKFLAFMNDCIDFGLIKVIRD